MFWNICFRKDSTPQKAFFSLLKETQVVHRNAKYTEELNPHFWTEQRACEQNWVQVKLLVLQAEEVSQLDLRGMCVILFIFVFLCANCLTSGWSVPHKTNVESSYTSIMSCTLKFWLFELTNWSFKSNYCLTCKW